MIKFSPTRICALRLSGAASLRWWARTLTALFAAAATMNLYIALACASSNVAIQKHSGLIKIAGIVSINGVRAASGQTLFSGSTIHTEANSESRITLDNQARLQLDGTTAIELKFSGAELAASLSEGAVQSFVPAGLAAKLETADALVTPDPAQPATFTIGIEDCTTKVFVHSGQVQVRAWHRVTSVRTGESFSTGQIVPAPPQQQNLSQRKRVGLFIGIGVGISLLAIVLTGRHAPPEAENFGGCVIVPSPGANNTCP